MSVREPTPPSLDREQWRGPARGVDVGPIAARARNAPRGGVNALSPDQGVLPVETTGLGVERWTVAPPDSAGHGPSMAPSPQEGGYPGQEGWRAVPHATPGITGCMPRSARHQGMDLPGDKGSVGQVAETRTGQPTGSPDDVDPSISPLSPSASIERGAADEELLRACVLWLESWAVHSATAEELLPGVLGAERPRFDPVQGKWPCAKLRRTLVRRASRSRRVRQGNGAQTATGDNLPSPGPARSILQEAA